MQTLRNFLDVTSIVTILTQCHRSTKGQALIFGAVRLLTAQEKDTWLAPKPKTRPKPMPSVFDLNRWHDSPNKVATAQCQKVIRPNFWKPD
jgi:hypothetical protein